MDRTGARPGTRRSVWTVGLIAALALVGTACVPLPVPHPAASPPPPPPSACASSTAASGLDAPTAASPKSLTTSQAAASATEATAEAARGPVTIVTAEKGDDGSLDIETHQTTTGSAPAVAADAARDGDLVAVDVPHPVTTEATSTDPQRTNQWALNDVHYESVWSLYQGTGVVVAVVDSGVQANHPDLVGRVLQGAQFLKSTDVSCGNGQTDGLGHGTHVAGIIAASANNGVGITGAAPRASILPVRVLDSSGSGTDTNVARGINWATTHGAKVINLSLGSQYPSTVLQAAVDNAVSHGVTVVAAAGNTNTSGGAASYPGSYPNVVAVAAVDSANVVAPFSTRGWYVDVAAPGVSVLSTYPVSSYAYMSGTSMATPYVSAALALLLQEFPTWMPAHLQSCLETTATHLGAAGKNAETGMGLVSPIAATACH